ncbi:MAG: hypothetical protein PHF84_10720 [bacterium]|nr:hypothetical protein [bacterium]
MKRFMFLGLLVLFLMSVSRLLGTTLWRDDFNKIENWYDNKAHPSYNAVIVPGKKAGTADVIQKGSEKWGKAAFTVSNVDVDIFNIIRVKVDKVEKNGDFKILASTSSWDKTFVVIDRGKGKGVHEGNIKEATGWKGKMTFNIVIVVEGAGKKVTLDWIALSSKESEDT